MTFTYTIKKSKQRKSVALAVKADSSVIVYAPYYMPKFFIDGFVKAKRDWVEEHIEKIKKREECRPRGSAQGDIFNQKHTRVDEQKYRTQALSLIQARLTYFNQYYNFSWKNITIRNQKTRWGSCSKQGNLNFNYKIALLSPLHADYIIVHELCHLGEFNHSSAFWALVSRTIPNYKILRKELKGTS